MIHVKLYSLHGEINGFEISGHSDYAEEGNDIVCASVSSCAYMVANTATEVVGLDADISVEDGYMSVRFAAGDAARIKDIMRGFEMHMKALADDYGEYIVCEKENI